ncbi:hypothetical protein HYPDE_36033 [Hyphomicrobium denitrificans 1NES1]|uniref:Uncharacterized protein n=1 Tax=Hyphomicrobium denitrificans 1NES1 TaxID=670307 RepID=N0B769_9HYPH|nr:hypothetical protein HYPDE_36033 [Hyphomicrobium denitrificans 1NES1]
MSLNGIGQTTIGFPGAGKSPRFAGTKIPARAKHGPPKCQNIRTAPLSTAQQIPPRKPAIRAPTLPACFSTALRPAFGSNQELTEFAPVP